MTDIKAKHKRPKQRGRDMDQYSVARLATTINQSINPGFLNWPK